MSIQSYGIDFLKKMKEQKLKINVCDLNTDGQLVKLKNKIILKQAGGSESKIGFGEIILFLSKIAGVSLQDEELKVALKLFTDYRRDINGGYDLDNINIGDRYAKKMYHSLFYEVEVYKYIYEKILSINVSPNFVSYVASGSCEYDKIKEMIDCKNCPKELYYEEKYVPDHKNVFFLFTENAINPTRYRNRKSVLKSFRQMQGELRNDFDSLKKILFQIIYSLDVMVRMKINHNDLHIDNILIAVLENPVRINYIHNNGIKDTIFGFDTKYIAQIIDWNFSQVQELGKNTLADEHNILLSDFSSTRDMYTLFSDLEIIATKSSTMRYKEKLSMLNSPNFKMKVIPKNSYDEIKKIPEIYENVRKVPRKIFDKLFGEASRHPPSTTLIPIISFEKGGEYYAAEYNAFQHRMSHESVAFFSPNEYIYLTKNFDSFIIVSQDSPEFTFDINNLAPVWNDREMYNNKLEFACIYEDNDEIKRILDAGNVDIEYGMRGACISGNESIVKLMLERGATKKEECAILALKFQKQNIVDLFATDPDIDKERLLLSSATEGDMKTANTLFDTFPNEKKSYLAKKTLYLSGFAKNYQSVANIYKSNISPEEKDYFSIEVAIENGDLSLVESILSKVSTKPYYATFLAKTIVLAYIHKDQITVAGAEPRLYRILLRNVAFSVDLFAESLVTDKRISLEDIVFFINFGATVLIRIIKYCIIYGKKDFFERLIGNVELTSQNAIYITSLCSTHNRAELFEIYIRKINRVLTFTEIGLFLIEKNYFNIFEDYLLVTFEKNPDISNNILYELFIASLEKEIFFKFLIRKNAQQYLDINNYYKIVYESIGNNLNSARKSFTQFLFNNKYKFFTVAQLKRIYEKVLFSEPVPTIEESRAKNYYDFYDNILGDICEFQSSAAIAAINDLETKKILNETLYVRAIIPAFTEDKKHHQFLLDIINNDKTRQYLIHINQLFILFFAKMDEPENMLEILKFPDPSLCTTKFSYLIRNMLTYANREKIIPIFIQNLQKKCEISDEGKEFLATNNIILSETKSSKLPESPRSSPINTRIPSTPNAPKKEKKSYETPVTRSQSSKNLPNAPKKEKKLSPIPQSPVIQSKSSKKSKNSKNSKNFKKKK